MGDLGGRQGKGGCAVRPSVCDNVSSDEARESGAEGFASEEVPERGVNSMPTTNRDTDRLKQVYELLVKAEVVEGPPGFRDVVAELWPELLHKVKPPISEMH
jgi:hypothetical protein